jgi:hypothetical protein
MTFHTPLGSCYFGCALLVDQPYLQGKGNICQFRIDPCSGEIPAVEALLDD